MTYILKYRKYMKKNKNKQGLPKNESINLCFLKYE